MRPRFAWQFVMELRMVKAKRGRIAYFPEPHRGLCGLLGHHFSLPIIKTMSTIKVIIFDEIIDYSGHISVTRTLTSLLRVHLDMKLLCKLILLVLLAKVLVSPPQGGAMRVVNQVGSVTLHDVACSINDAWTNVETWASGLWSSQVAPAKAVPHRGATAHHPAS